MRQFSMTAASAGEIRSKLCPRRIDRSSRSAARYRLYPGSGTQYPRNESCTARGAAAALWRPKCSRSRILSNRCRRSHPTRTPKNQKAPLSRGSFGFGRTRRIRTADLYHVKADWPHQDTRGHTKTSGERWVVQGFCGHFQPLFIFDRGVEAECWRERIAIVRFPESRRPLRFRWVVSGSLSHQSGRRKYRACGRQKRETA